MPAASATPEVWEAVRTASLKGVSDDKLVEYFGVTKNAIWSRRFDDPVWAAAKKDQIVMRKKKTQEQENKIQKAAEQVETVTALSLQEIGEQSSLLLARYGHEKIKIAVDGDLIPAPSNWSELKTVSEVIRKATGQDKDQAPVMLNLFGSDSFGLPEGSGDLRDVGPVVETQEADSDDFC